MKSGECSDNSAQNILYSHPISENTKLEVLPPVFYGYEAGPFMLRDKPRVKAFENGELGKYLGSERTK